MADWDGVLVRFGEIGIKSAPVRRGMTNRLRQNILDALLRDGISGDVVAAGSRLWVVGPEPARLAQVAARIFGVVSVSLARRVPSDIPSVAAAASDVALRLAWTSFAVRASREGTHPYTSQDVAVQVGSAVWKAAEAAGRQVRVDLSQPDQEVFVEVRAGEAFVYTSKQPGPGGLPLGSQGSVVALLSDRTSFVAAWLAMRRGCRVVGLHAGTTGSLPVDATACLRSWGMRDDIELLPVCTGSVGKPVLLDAAAQFAQQIHAAALVTGDSLASQLLAPAAVPVLRPVCGLPPADVDAYAARMGLPDDAWPDSLLRPDARETVESLMAMRRRVPA